MIAIMNILLLLLILILIMMIKAPMGGVPTYAIAVLSACCSVACLYFLVIRRGARMYVCMHVCMYVCMCYYYYYY